MNGRGLAIGLLSVISCADGPAIVDRPRADALQCRDGVHNLAPSTWIAPRLAAGSGGVFLARFEGVVPEGEPFPRTNEDRISTAGVDGRLGAPVYRSTVTRTLAVASDGDELLLGTRTATAVVWRSLGAEGAPYNWTPIPIAYQENVAFNLEVAARGPDRAAAWLLHEKVYFAIAGGQARLIAEEQSKFGNSLRLIPRRLGRDLLERQDLLRTAVGYRLQRAGS